MPDSDELLELLQDAEDRDQLATARVLYEAILDKETDQAALQVLYAANLIELGDLTTAEQVISQIDEIEEQETQAGLLTQKANLARACADFSKAESFYREAHKLVDDGGENLLNAAFMASQQGETAKAEYLLREAVKIESEFQCDAWFNLAGNLISQQRYDEARKCYETVLTMEPDHGLAQEWLEDLDQREEMLQDSSV